MEFRILEPFSLYLSVGTMLLFVRPPPDIVDGRQSLAGPGDDGPSREADKGNVQQSVKMGVT